MDLALYSLANDTSESFTANAPPPKRLKLNSEICQHCKHFFLRKRDEYIRVLEVSD